MRHFRLILSVVLLVTFFTSTVVHGQQPKTSVCHITGTYDLGAGPVDIGHVITIADPALPTHIDHGDTTTFVEVTLPDGKIACTPDIDSDGDGVLNSADACNNPGALSLLGQQGITFTVSSNGCLVLDNSIPQYAQLQGINLVGADLSLVNLNGVNLDGANLSGANLSGTTGAAVGGSSPISANGANFTGANFTQSYLYSSTLVNANLSGANFTAAYLVGVDMTGADLSGTIFMNTYCPDGFFGNTCVNHL